MANNVTYWKRVGRIEIQGNDGKMHSFGGNDGLDFKFSGEKVGNVYTEFKVSILGLSAETINDLTVWSPADSLKAGNMRLVRVYAGYEYATGAGLIFEGTILNAVPTSPPEMWLNIDCLLRLDGGDMVSEPFVMFQKSFDNIFYLVADELGLKCRNDVKKWNVQKKLKDRKFNFELSGRKQDLVDRFARTFGIKCYKDGGILVATDKRPWQNSPQSATRINLNSGMIDIPKVDIVGCNIKVRLNDAYGLMSWIYLESELIPSANGYYCVLAKKHVGHFRGNEWYTELECIRQGAQV